MTPADRDRVAAGLPEHKAKGFECAGCGGAPSCPMLHDNIWATISPGADKRCGGCGHQPYQHRTRGLLPKPGPCGRDHTDPSVVACECLQYRPKVSDLLCVACAEQRLGRPIELADLMPCVGNLAIYDMIEGRRVRALERTARRIEGQIAVELNDPRSLLEHMTPTGYKKP